jgi:hypothetical protein
MSAVRVVEGVCSCGCVDRCQKPVYAIEQWNEGGVVCIKHYFDAALVARHARACHEVRIGT